MCRNSPASADKIFADGESDFGSVKRRPCVKHFLLHLRIRYLFCLVEDGWMPRRRATKFLLTCSPSRVYRSRCSPLQHTCSRDLPGSLRTSSLTRSTSKKWLYCDPSSIMHIGHHATSGHGEPCAASESPRHFSRLNGKALQAPASARRAFLNNTSFLPPLERRRCVT